MVTRLWHLVFALALVFAASCGEGTENSMITLVIDAGNSVRAQTTSLRFRHPSGEHSFEPTGGWPFVVSFTAKPVTRGWVVVDAIGDDGVITSRALDFTVLGGRHAIDVFLPDACISAPRCADKQTCGDCGTCVTEEIDPESLREVRDRNEATARYAQPTCTRIDAGMDGGGAAGDGSVATDGAAIDGSMVSMRDADADTDANITTDASAPSGLGLGVAPAVATGRCIAVEVTRTGETALSAAFADVNATLGGLYSDRDCTHATAQASWAAGQASTTIYYGAPRPLPSGLVANAEIAAALAGKVARAVVEVRTGAKALARGLSFGCVLLETGQVQCFGDNSYATFGLSSGGGGVVAVPIPSDVTAHPDAQFLGGDYHSCFLHAGSLRCFGLPEGLGAGASPGPQPAQVLGLDEGVLQADPGYFGGCAVQGGASRTLWCWGRHSGECDVPSGSIDTPVKVRRLDDSNVTNATNLVEECSFTNSILCARTTDGAVRCWGWLYSGTVKVIESGAIKLSGHGSETCAVVDTGSDHEIHCFRPQALPQVTKIRGLPAGPVDLIAGGVEASLEQGAACAVKAGELYCWGNNVMRFYSPTGLEDRDRAVRITLPAGKIEAIAVGFAGADGPVFSAIVDGLVYTWGAAVYGATGLDEKHELVKVPAPSSVLNGVEMAELSIGATTTCFRQTNGRGRCFGEAPGNGVFWPALGAHAYSPIELAQDLQIAGEHTLVPLEGLTHIHAGVDNSCFAVTENQGDGTLWVWGQNFGGQLGIADERSLWPTDTTSLNNLLADPVQVTTGIYGDSQRSNACALMTDGSVHCVGLWPEDVTSQTIVYQKFETPQRVIAPDSNVTAIAASCVLNGGAVECFRDISFQRSAVAGMPSSGLVELDASRRAVCARTGTDVYCAFDHAAAKLTFSNATTVAVGESFACALLVNGKIQCAGFNDYAQLGRAVPSTPAPAGNVVGINAATKLVVGDRQACALDAGSWKCWGKNSSGHLGVVPFIYSTPQLLPAWGP